MPTPKRDVHAWVQARVDEHGGVHAAKPDDFTRKAWEELCRHLGVTSPRFKKVRTLEDALKAVADLASP